MITPAYSLTSNERVLPRMALDFTTASLDSRVTVTRALNTATRITSSGSIETVNANLPRFDFDPVSKICKGLLIEEARVNLARYSQTFDSSWWARFNMGLDINAANSPLGTNTACKLKTNTTAGIHLTFSTIAASVAGNPYTSSVLAKAGEYKWLYVGDVNVGSVYFNLETGVFGNIDPGVSAYGKIDMGDGWWRVYTITTAVANSGPLVGLAPANGGVSTAGANNTDGIYITGVQWEAGAFPTSYVPNLSSGTTTRNADAVSMTGTNFSSWYNASEGTITSEMSGTGTNFGGIAFDDGTNNNTIEYVVASGRAVAGVKVANASQLYSQSAAITSGSISRYALAYKQSNFAFSANASVLGPYLSGNIPTVNRAIIGLYLGASWYLNGHMRKVAYYPQRLTNAEVQAFSKI